jgi:predicted transcriptional regulator
MKSFKKSHDEILQQFAIFMILRYYELNNKSMNYQEIGEILSINRATIYKLVRDLKSKNLVILKKDAPTKPFKRFYKVKTFPNDVTPFQKLFH